VEFHALPEVVHVRQRVLDRTGLASHIDQVISAADVGKWKPPVEVYRRALDRIGRHGDQVALVAVACLRLPPAHAAGLTTGWAARLEKHYGKVFDPADVIGHDLVAVANGLLALPQASPPPPS